jgi:hypothetical protein
MAAHKRELDPRQSSICIYAYGGNLESRYVKCVLVADITSIADITSPTFQRGV